MKKILFSASAIAVVAAMVVAGTGAFFSDEETSEGNVFTAGAIDLKVSNESYYNGERSPNTSWEAGDLEGQLFFNFTDLKPGDWGEDTIDLVVDNNDAWVCADVTLTKNDEVSLTEPEEDVGDTADDPQDLWDGELAQELEFIWWADDGDNVLESDEEVLTRSTLGQAPQDESVVVKIADSELNIWSGQTDDPLTGEETYYIGKAWCFGELEETPVGADQGQDPTVDPGITCDGNLVTNWSQTDSAMLDVSFTAVQSRNNADFVCGVGEADPEVTTGPSWAPNASVQEWLGKVKVQEPNPASDFEIQVGVGDSDPLDFDQDDTVYSDDVANSFTLSYDGSGGATLVVDGHGSVSYSVGTGPYAGNIGLTLRAPSDATTSVDALKFNGSSLSTDSTSVSDGTSYLYVSGVDLDSAWTLTGTFTFDWDTLTSNGENQKVQMSIN